MKAIADETDPNRPTIATKVCDCCAMPFVPVRATARFCSARCRVSNGRRLRHQARQEPVGGIFTAPGTGGKRLSVTAPRASLVIAPGVIPDGKWAGMYRVRLPDDSFTDLLNLSRANDLAR